MARALVLTETFIQLPTIGKTEGDYIWYWLIWKTQTAI